MPDAKISALPELIAVADTDTVPIVTGAGNRRTTVQRLNRKVTNMSTAAQSLTASTLTLITGTTLPIPTGVLVGTTTQFQWKIVASKTAAGAVANVFHIRAGTAGTTADTALFTFTTAVGTAVADAARIDVLLTVRTAGASGILQATFTMGHNLSATGWLNIPMNTITATSAAFNLTTPGLIFSMSATTGAAMVATVNQATAEVVNV